MKYILISLITLLGFNPLFSQKDTSQFYNKTLSENNFSIELGGKAGFYSLGYERTIYKSKKLLLAGSINLSYEPYVFKGIVIPIGIITMIGEKQNKLLFGLSAMNGFDFDPYPKTRKERQTYRVSGWSYYPLYTFGLIEPSIGYRRYFKKGNSISIAFTPIILLLIDDSGKCRYGRPKDTLPWFGINYNFKI